eukprot:304408-Hanusia_phi.AAC.1
MPVSPRGAAPPPAWRRAPRRPVACSLFRARALGGEPAREERRSAVDARALCAGERAACCPAGDEEGGGDARERKRKSRGGRRTRTGRRREDDQLRSQGKVQPSEGADACEAGEGGGGEGKEGGRGGGEDRSVPQAAARSRREGGEGVSGEAPATDEHARGEGEGEGGREEEGREGGGDEVRDENGGRGDQGGERKVRGSGRVGEDLPVEAFSSAARATADEGGGGASGGGESAIVGRVRAEEEDGEVPGDAAGEGSAAGVQDAKRDPEMHPREP